MQIMYINIYYAAAESAVIINHDIIDNNDYDIVMYSHDSCDNDGGDDDES